MTEAFGHAGFDCSFRDSEDLGDFGKAEVLIMPEDENAAVDGGQAGEGGAHGGVVIRPEELLIGLSVRGWEAVSGVGGGVVGWVGRGGPRLAALFPEVVVAKVDGDPPEEGGELCGGLVSLSVGVDASEGFLGEVLGGLDVAGHSGAEVLDWGLPSVDQGRERNRVVLGLDEPHGLFVGGWWWIETGQPHGRD